MQPAGQYQGSQAFNNINPLTKESVNPNTGSLNFSTPVVKLQGVRDSIDLTVNLFYSFGFRGTFGLPPNWGLDLPYVLHDKSVSAQGRTYAIDTEWTDVKGHASGLRYTNNHGIRFQPVVPPKPLPSRQQGEYGYELNHVDGSVDYFDALGKPIQHQDIYGNFVYYSYVTGDQGGVDSPELRIDHILDSWGQKIRFSYEQGYEMRITLPDGGETSIRYSNDGVYAIIDAAGNRTDVEYAPFNDGPGVPHKINYPSGLTSRYDYTAIQYLNDQGNPKYLPAVEDFRSLDSAGNIYQHARYIYGSLSLSTHTYTGAAIGCMLGGSADSLMDNDDRALEYRYDVIILSLDQDEKPIAKTCTWFNNLHLPIQETRFLLNDEGKFVDAYQTIFKYNVDKEKRARITSYNLPIATEGFRNITSQGDPTWQPTTRTEAEYNEYGNASATIEWLHVDDVGYIKQSSVKTDYSKTKMNVQLPVKSWNIDEISRTLEYKEQTPSEDGRSIATTITSFQDSYELGAQLQPRKEVRFEYDPNGRPISKTTSWGPDIKVPDNFIKSVTTKTEYAFRDGILSRIEIDAQGNLTVFNQDMRQANSPVVKKILPHGQTECFEYDRIGRPVKHINALGQTTVTTYTVGPTGTSQTVTSPLKYCKRTSFDVLGREILVCDNGDPTLPFTDQPSRVLSCKKYNSLSLVQESTDRLGMTTRLTYNALGRPLTMTDPHGNILSYRYDNGNLRVTQAVNGDTRRVIELDALSRPNREVTYPDSGNQSTPICLVQDLSYNGNGKVIRKAFSHRPNTTNGTTTLALLETEMTEYGPNQTVQSQTITGYTERGADTVIRRYVRDLFDNKATYTKHTSYADGRSFTHQGPTQIYNENNQMILYRNQEGNEQRFVFDKNGWCLKTVRFDGTDVVYTCSNVGQTIKVAYPTITTENTFNADGKLVETREGTDVIKYLASLDGTLTGIVYGDNRTQSITLDKFSRPVKETDVFGVTKEIEYNGVGLVTRRSCQGDTVTYTYGTANHTHGQYLSSMFSGSRNFQSSISYDGFGSLRQNTVRDSASALLLETTYQRDAREKIKSLKSVSTLFAEHNNEQTYSYDGIGQVVQEIHIAASPSVTKYAYDGNANVVSVDTDGQLTSMAYNKIDQRIDEGFKYDTNGRLKQDDEGQKYFFDERDRLISVSRDKSTPTKFAYRSDDHLAEQHHGDADSATLYHNASKISAVHTTKKEGSAQDAKTSLFSDSDSILAGYTDGQPAGHFFHQLGSTALIIGPETHVSAGYGAYGVNKVAPIGNILSNFGFKQGFTDCKSRLIYLDSRFYNPKQLSFLSMDTYYTENRYAYCEGDPINRIDPSGHSWVDLAALGASIVVPLVVGALVTAATGGLGFPAVTAVLAGALGGAMGNLSSLAIHEFVGGEHVSFNDYWRGAATGGIIGGLSSGLGYASTNFAKNAFIKAVAGGAIVGGFTGAAGATIVMGFKGEELDASRVLFGGLKGAALGVFIGYWGRRTYFREQAMRQALPSVSLSSSSSFSLDKIDEIEMVL